MTRIYVRISDDGFEGQSLRFVTTDEESALNRFEIDSEFYAPDYSGEELQVWEDGRCVKTYERHDKKWLANYYSSHPEEYGVVKACENRGSLVVNEIEQ